MGKIKKFFILLITCIYLMFFTTGCWNSRELNAIAIVLGTGIDKSPEQGKIQITAQIVKPESLRSSGSNKGGGSSNDKSFWNASYDGETVFSSIRGLTHVSPRKLFWPHNQVIIFGKSVAFSGIKEYIDFFLRDHEPRISAYILVSDTTARDVFEVTPKLEKVTSMNINSLMKNQSSTSQTVVTKFKEFLTDYMSKTKVCIAPIIRITGEGEGKTISVSGLAMFKDLKMTGQLDENETRGVLWATGKVKSGIITVDIAENNKKVSFETIKARSKITPEIKDNTIIMKININAEGNIGENTGNLDITKLEVINALEKAVTNTIKNEIMSAVKKAKEFDTDVFGFGNLLYEKYPEQWLHIGNDWDVIFKNVQTEISVNTNIILEGKINKPASMH